MEWQTGWETMQSVVTVIRGKRNSGMPQNCWYHAVEGQLGYFGWSASHGKTPVQDPQQLFTLSVRWHSGIMLCAGSKVCAAVALVLHTSCLAAAVRASNLPAAQELEGGAALSITRRNTNSCPCQPMQTTTQHQHILQLCHQLSPHTTRAAASEHHWPLPSQEPPAAHRHAAL